MFSAGDYVHHVTGGLCLVEEITTLDMSGVDSKKLYYRLKPIGETSGTLYSPVDNPRTVMRKAVGEQEARMLIDDMPSIETLWIPEERAREQRYKEALMSMDLRSWVRIIKTLYLRKMDRLARGQKTTSTDERYLHIAENLLYSELGRALGIPKENMEDYITEHLSG